MTEANESNQPLGLASTDVLGPLPFRYDVVSRRGDDGHVHSVNVWSEHDMCAYAERAVGAEHRRMNAILAAQSAIESLNAVGSPVELPVGRLVPERATFSRGDLVRKRSGSQWQGRVVGEYSTMLTPEGYAVEAEVLPGSVQIYPAAALELVECGKTPNAELTGNRRRQP